MAQIEKFCEIIRKRSAEHTEAMSRIHDLPSMMASVLRQELDSMVRVIYLLSINDISQRERLINQTLNGEIWSILINGKFKKITDREMVELSTKIHGWSLSVYKFGCAFIHFSNFHDYTERNPFEMITPEAQNDILVHLRNYHGGPLTDKPSFTELSSYFPKVFEKISGNLECYVESLEANETGSQCL